MSAFCGGVCDVLANSKRDKQVTETRVVCTGSVLCQIDLSVLSACYSPLIHPT